MELKGRKLVLAVTGGVAAYKAAEFARLLGKAGADVHVVLTAAGARFVTAVTFQALTGNPVWQDLWDARMDNNMALEPDEMGTLVRNCENVYESMGTYERFVSDIEYTQRLKMRRSIVAARDLQAGDILTLSDLDVKRPGNGLAPGKLAELVGRRIKNDIPEDSMIFESDLM